MPPSWPAPAATKTQRMMRRTTLTTWLETLTEGTSFSVQLLSSVRVDIEEIVAYLPSTTHNASGKIQRSVDLHNSPSQHSCHSVLAQTCSHCQKTASKPCLHSCSALAVLVQPNEAAERCALADQRGVAVWLPIRAQQAVQLR